MTEPRPIVRTITLAGTAFPVPPLPIDPNREVYPICQRLTAAGIVDRAIAAQGALDCEPEEFDRLADAIFLSIKAGGAPLDRTAFNALPITPPEMLDAFFTIRYQTGAWLAPPPQAEGKIAEGRNSGEAKGAKRPRK